MLFSTSLNLFLGIPTFQLFVRLVNIDGTNLPNSIKVENTGMRERTNNPALDYTTDYTGFSRGSHFFASLKSEVGAFPTCVIAQLVTIVALACPALVAYGLKPCGLIGRQVHGQPREIALLVVSLPLILSSAFCRFASASSAPLPCAPFSTDTQITRVKSWDPRWKGIKYACGKRSAAQRKNKQAQGRRRNDMRG